jgi:S-adenosylmethionine-dependent methyltransferase
MREEMDQSEGKTGGPRAEEQNDGSSADARFEDGATRYADYLLTIEGRLRLDLAWENLREVAAGQFLRGVGGEFEGHALDAGAGTGALALRLAAEGWRVAILDASAAMLALAESEAQREGLTERLSFHRADAARAAELFPSGSFDLAICHNVLEYVDDAAAVVAALSSCVRAGGLVSLLARNRAGEALRAAVQRHDLSAAREALDAESVRESLYGGPARLFDAEVLAALVAEAALEVFAVRGVRVVADYLPPALAAAPADYARLLQFEAELGARAEFAAVARYTQLFARRL